MNSLMTTTAHRYKLEPLFGLIACKMVILCSCLAARTLEVRRWVQEQISNRFIYRTYSLPLQRVLFSPSQMCTCALLAISLSLSSYFYGLLTFFTVQIPTMTDLGIRCVIVCFCVSLALIATLPTFLIFCHTLFALIRISIWRIAVFVKVRQWFSLLAFRAGLCYDGFRHDCLLQLNRYCLGPAQAQSYAGSFIIPPSRAEGKS